LRRNLADATGSRFVQRDSTASLIRSLRSGSRGVRLDLQRRRSLRDQRCEIF